MRLIRQLAARRAAGGQDSGMTLVELLIASSLLVVLSTLIMVTMSIFGSVSSSVSAQYREYDTMLPAISNMRPLIQAEVEPDAPDATGAPIPGFGVDSSTGPTNTVADTVSGIGNFALTFYSNVGYTVGGVVMGPAKIVAGLTTPSGAPATPSSTTCTERSPCNFQVKEYLPLCSWGSGSDASCTDPPGPHETATPTCPTTSTSVDCVYGTTYTLVTNVQNVVNSATEPVFSYSVFDPGNDDASGNFFNLTSAELSASPTTFTVPSADYGVTSADLNSCKPATTDVVSGTTFTLPLAVECPADAVQRVGIDLYVQVVGDQAQPARTSTIIYRDQGNATSPTLPFQYSLAVG